MSRCWSIRSQGGFTLVEVMASLVVFTILLLGVTPLVASSLQGAALNREYTVAKNLATEAMERIRGLPFYDAASNRDVLDLYFPDLATGYNAADQTFTTVCTPSTSSPTTSGALACPPKNSDGTARIPTGFTVTFRAVFTEVVFGSDPEEYADVAPPTGWTSNAEPPTRLLRMSIETTWTQGARPKSYELRSFIGDRKLSQEKVRGDASVDFLIQALTSYQQDLLSPIRTLKAIGGNSTSTIQVKNFATASQDTSAVKMTLERQEFGTTEGDIVTDQSGAQAAVIAPPDSSPAPVVNADGFTVASDGLTPAVTIAGATTTSVHESSPVPGVSVVNQLPSAAGNFAFTAGAGLDHFWVNNQADADRLKLDATKKIFSVHRVGEARMRGNTSAVATSVAPTSGRKVESVAHAEFPKAVVLPTTFIGSGNGVVLIENFAADVSCTSTGNAGTAAVTGTWSASLRYWRDTTLDLTANGGYSAPIALGGSLGSAAADPLAAINRSNNPLVYEALVASNNVYLFDDPTALKTGYLDSWSTAPFISSSKTATRSTVDIEFAIQIVTAQTNLNNEQTKLALSIGSLSCSAQDLR